MKLSKYLVGTLACALVAGCANEDTPAVDNGTQVQEGSSYMAVNLVMSTDAASRAADDGGFDNGTDVEGGVSISKSVFLFYDAAGKYLTKGNIITDEIPEGGKDPDADDDDILDWDTSYDDSGNNIENKSNAVVILGPTESIPTQVLAVLNGESSTLAGLSLSEAIAATTEGKISGEKEGDFLMTNSTYVDNNKIVTATQITTNNLAENPEDAIKEGVPVEIYVERVAAKLTVKETITTETDGKKSVELTGDNYVLDNATGATMKVVIDGWCANAINTSSYYVKNLDNKWLDTNTDPFKDWKGTYRTFWAKDANYTGNGASDWDATPANRKGTYKGLTYYAWKDATKANGAIDYLHENTINNTEAEVEGGDNTNVTTVLVAAHIVYKKAGESDYSKPADIFKQNGVYYTENVLKQNIVASGNYNWYYTQNGTPTSQPLSVDDVTIKFAQSTETNAKPGDIKLTVSITKPTITGINEGDILLIQGSNTTPIDIPTAESALATGSYTENLVGYKDGACYYQIPIEHLSSTDAKRFYGIVRNHSYELTITNITDIGGPIYDKEDPLPPIPGKDKNYYMAAKLNVLAWKVVTQSAVLD